MTKQTRQLVMMLAIGILIGIISINIFTNDSDVYTTPNESTTVSGVENIETKNISTVSGEEISQAKQQSLPPSIPLNSRVGLTVTDQFRATTVSVSGLNVDAISWVAIYDEREGRPSVILGAQKIRPGEKDAIVELLRHEGTIAGMNYFAAILPDNGDGVFNRLTDLPPFSSEKSIIVKFKAL